MNPFTPTFGKLPPVLAGRAMLINEVEQALTDGGGNPNLYSLFTGPRGVGKTVLLSYLSDYAQDNGWVSADVTARSGMLEDIFERATEAANKYVAKKGSARLTSVGIASLFEATWEYRDPKSGNWRTRMSALLSKLEAHNIGLLITIDEVDPSLDELVDFAATFQHFIREGRKVALMMAGLPAQVSSLISDKSVSFLRRASQHSLGRISDADIRDAFEATVAEAGKSIDSSALDAAVKSIDGFAYMMQLVGFRTWNCSGDADVIGLSAVEEGSLQAMNDFRNGVLKRTCAELSDGDLSFLLAMLEDDGPSRMADIAQRMDKTTNYARVYRKRLEEEGLVTSPRRGMVAFEMPFLREYLEEEY